MDKVEETKRRLTWDEIDSLMGTKTDEKFKVMVDYFLEKNKELLASPVMDDDYEYKVKYGLDR